MKEFVESMVQNAFPHPISSQLLIFCLYSSPQATIKTSMCRLTVKSELGNWQSRMKYIHSVQLLYFLILKSCSSYYIFFLHKKNQNIPSPGEYFFLTEENNVTFDTTCKIHRLKFVNIWQYSQIKEQGSALLEQGGQQILWEEDNATFPFFVLLKAWLHHLWYS